MSIVVTLGLRCLGVMISEQQSDHKIVQDGEYLRHGAMLAAARIFTERHVPAIMQFTFDGPVSALQGQQTVRAGFGGCQTGQAIHHFVAQDFTRQRRNQPFELEDLGQVRPMGSFGSLRSIMVFHFFGAFLELSSSAKLNMTATLGLNGLHG